jgi:hypothetical protein
MSPLKRKHRKKGFLPHHRKGTSPKPQRYCSHKFVLTLSRRWLKVKSGKRTLKLLQVAMPFSAATVKVAGRVQNHRMLL